MVVAVADHPVAAETTPPKKHASLGTGSVIFGVGKNTVVTGSYLEFVYPEYAIWEEGVASYIYPFIFSSDSDRT